MTNNKIHLVNIYGKIVPFTADKIESALIGRMAGVPEFWGETYVWAESPIMVCIYKTRNTKRGPFYFEIIEIDQNSVGKLIDIVYLKLNVDKLKEAVKIFMDLCQKPKKTYQRKMIKKMGGRVIFINKLAKRLKIH